MKGNTSFLLVLLIGSGYFVAGQDVPLRGQAKPHNEEVLSKEQMTEAVFNDMLLVLPGSIQSKLDSLKRSNSKNAQIDLHGNLEGSPSARNDIRGAQGHPPSRAIDDLPDELRSRIEHAIRELERNRNERGLEFKDRERKIIK